MDSPSHFSANNLLNEKEKIALKKCEMLVEFYFKYGEMLKAGMLISLAQTVKLSV